MTILAILNRAETAEAVLYAAIELRSVLGNVSIRALHPRPDVEPDFMPTEEMMSPERQAVFEAEQNALSAALRRVAEQHLPYDGMAEQRGKVRAMVAEAAKDATLVIAGAAGHAGWSLARDAIEAVLFDAAAPLLLLPNRSVPLTERVVAVAWERSPASEGAVDAALPLLLAAERVVVLEAEEGHARASLPAALLDGLGRRGKAADIQRFTLGDRDVGTAILDAATSAGAGLLVMGAFTHRRLLERLFGGATQEILEGARIPLLLHH